VWEHLTEEEGRRAAALCFRSLRPGGLLRCAVPDGNFPDRAYQNQVRVGGPGSADHPAADHKIVYDAPLLQDVLRSAGFEVDVLEWCDEQGRFHFRYHAP
jgi:predicted SAM-dependent methyltransferase